MSETQQKFSDTKRFVWDHRKYYYAPSCKQCGQRHDDHRASDDACPE